MQILKITPFNNYQNKYTSFEGKKIPVEYSDLKVFYHHIYEYKKGIRNLILTTENNL